MHHRAPQFCQRTRRHPALLNVVQSSIGIDSIFGRFRKKANDQQLDDTNDQVLVDIRVAKEVQGRFDILPHEVSIFRREIHVPRSFGYGVNDRRRAFSFDLLRFGGGGYWACGCEGVVGEECVSRGEEDLRHEGRTEDSLGDLRG